MAKPMAWKRENCLKDKIPNKPGVYKFYNNRGQVIYVGHAKRLRHRVQTYYQKDNYYEHSSKLPLRPEIKKYSYKVMPYSQAKLYEKKVKIEHNPKHNYW